MLTAINRFQLPLHISGENCQKGRKFFETLVIMHKDDIPLLCKMP